MGTDIILNGTLKKGMKMEQVYDKITIDVHDMSPAEMHSDLQILFEVSQLIYAQTVIIIGGFDVETSDIKIITPILELHTLSCNLELIIELVTGFDEVALVGDCDPVALRQVAALNWVTVFSLESLVMTKISATSLEKLFMSNETAIEFIVSMIGVEVIIETGLLKRMVQKTTHQITVIQPGISSSEEVLLYQLGNVNSANVLYRNVPIALKFLYAILSSDRILVTKFKHMDDGVPDSFNSNVRRESSRPEYQIKGKTNKVAIVNGQLCVYRF